MKELLDLFLTFARVGGLTFGGGYAMLPMLQREVCGKKNWATEQDLMDYYAIGQCTPGVIAVNTATFIGEKVGGTIGSIFATLGMIFPSLVIITSLAAVLGQVAHFPLVQHALAGVRIAVCALVLHSVVQMGKKGVVDKMTAGILVVAFVCVRFLGFSPIATIALGAAAGVLVQRWRRHRRRPT